MYQLKDQIASACPSPDAFLEAYKGAGKCHRAIGDYGWLIQEAKTVRNSQRNMLLAEAPGNKYRSVR